MEDIDTPINDGQKKFMARCKIDIRKYGWSTYQAHCRVHGKVGGDKQFHDSALAEGRAHVKSEKAKARNK